MKDRGRRPPLLSRRLDVCLSLSSENESQCPTTITIYTPTQYQQWQEKISGDGRMCSPPTSLLLSFMPAYCPTAGFSTGAGAKIPRPAILTPESLNEHFTKAYVWTPPTWVAPVWDDPTKKFKESNDTPISGKSNPTLNEPLPLNWNKNPKEKVNLFCSGHCFLPDGRLLIVGGHISDNTGSNQACTYDYQSNMFKASVELNGGRWYSFRSTSTRWQCTCPLGL